MKPKAHHTRDLRPANLVHPRRIKNKQVTPPSAPIQHHAQQHALVFLAGSLPPDPVGGDKHGFAGGVAVAGPGLYGAGVGVGFDERVVEGGLSGVEDAVYISVGVGEEVGV